MLQVWRMLYFNALLVLLTLFSCYCVSHGQNITEPGGNMTGPGGNMTGPGGNMTGPGGNMKGPGDGNMGPGPGGMHFSIHSTSFRDIKKMKERCRHLKNDINSRGGQGRGGGQGKGGGQENQDLQDLEQKYSMECEGIDSFTFRNLTADEILNWIYSSGGDADMVYALAREISLVTLKQLLYNATRQYWGMQGHPMKPVLVGLGQVYMDRLGRSLTVDHIRFLGPAFVYSIPANIISRLPPSIIDFMLEMISTETIKAVAEWNSHDENTPRDQYYEPQYDGAATIHAFMNDLPRLKALCWATFKIYRRIENEPTLNKTLIMMICAPVKVCKSLSVALVQNNINHLSRLLPWACTSGNMVSEESDGVNMAEMQKNYKKSFPQMPVCGRYIANKAMEPGPNQLIIDSAEKITSLQSLSFCLHDKYLMQGVDVVGCQMALEPARRGFFSKRVVRYISNKCMTMPEDFSNITCQDIRTNYGPMLARIDKRFWKELPIATMCHADCLAAFEEVDLPSNVRMKIMKKCFASSDTVIDRATIAQMGAMVTQLPINKLAEVSAADLAGTLENIKQDYKATKAKRKKDPRRRVVARTIAKKLALEGDLANITDSAEMMRAVSLKDLKSAVTDIEADLGLNDPNKNVVLTDSQNKWVMRKLMKEKQASNFSADDIRSKKSIVKGFLSSDIKDMGEAHNDTGIELAKALCEQSNWPLKPLKAINRDMIVKTLEARNSTHPMQAFTDMDVGAIGCECMMHFRNTELRQMEPEVCSAVCQKVGYCNNFRCLNPTQRKNFLQACLECKGLGVNLMTDVDFDELGPNLISQLSETQISTLVPSSVLVGQLGALKDMCMNKRFAIAVSSKLEQEFGSNVDFDSLSLMGSKAMLFSKATLQAVNMTFVANLAENFVEELSPTDESIKKLRRCCRRWLQTDDINHLDDLKHNLMIAIKDAIVYQMTSSRRKREVVSWTCANMQLVSEAFTTVSNEDIMAMNDTEFINCLPDIGALSSWTGAQKTVLLNKTEEAFGTSVCTMASSDLLNLGNIAVALPVSSINCLPLEEDDTVASFGALSEWTTEQLTAFATRYMSVRNLTAITNFTSSDVALLGNLLCGFSPSRLADISATTFAASGTQLGALSQCPTAQLVQLKTIAIDADAYGPIADWTASEVGELNFILAGLTGAEIQDLSVSAIEGLSSQVIPKIPANTLKDMTVAQLEAFTDVQAVSVTQEQKDAMTTAQKGVLDAATSGGQDPEPEVTVAPSPPPRSIGLMTGVETLLLCVSVLVMLLLST